MNQVEATMFDEMTGQDGDLFPEVRAKESAVGTPTVLGDGNSWLLADGGLNNFLDEARDRIDDEARLRGKVDGSDIRNVAFHLLKANYDLSDGEAASLILDTDLQPLTEAVSLALFGSDSPRRTYSSWAAASLLANAIDPATVPSKLMPHVLAILVQTGRTVAAGKYIESAEASVKLAALRTRAGASVAAKAQPKPEAPPDPPALPALPPEPTG